MQFGFCLARPVFVGRRFLPALRPDQTLPDDGQPARNRIAEVSSATFHDACTAQAFALLGGTHLGAHTAAPHSPGSPGCQYTVPAQGAGLFGSTRSQHCSVNGAGARSNRLRARAETTALNRPSHLTAGDSDGQAEASANPNP